MGDFDDFDSYEDNSSDWIDETGGEFDTSDVEGIDFESEQETTKDINNGINLGIVGRDMKGKSLMASLIAYLNLEYFEEVNQEWMEKFPKTYALLKEEKIPEVKELRVVDFDKSYENRSKAGIFGRLMKPIWNEDMPGKIIPRKLDLPNRDMNKLDKTGKKIFLNDLKRTLSKIKITLKEQVDIARKREGVALMLDPMSKLTRVVNKRFKVYYEIIFGKNALEMLDGVKQSYYQVRNDEWADVMGLKREYNGWQIDTFKSVLKQPHWFEKDVSRAKNIGMPVKYVNPENIKWVKDTYFDLDIVMMINNDTKSYWAKVKNRFEGNKSKYLLEDIQKITYTPKKRSGMIEIIEELGPSISGWEDELSDEDLW